MRSLNKHQMTNPESQVGSNDQIPGYGATRCGMSADSDIEYCDFFGTWCLMFGMWPPSGGAGLKHLNFDIGICFEFRISDFGFAGRSPS